MVKMKRLAFISLLLLLVSHLTHSRSIREDSNLAISDDGESKSSSFLEWSYLSATTETCEPTYGFLPCSSNVWGLLFLIVVYEFLLSLGGKYVATGSNLFFQIIGPGIFGASLFQFLGTIPQIVLILVSTLSGSLEAAQQRASLGMGLVAGTTVMLLTLIWGTSVVLGSYDLSAAITIDKSGSRKSIVVSSSAGYGIVTDVETSYTARIMLITLVPFLILLLAKVFHSSSGRRVTILIALIVTFILLFAYIFYQTRTVVDPYQQQNSLLLGVKMDDDDLSTDRDVENILGSFDTSGRTYQSG
ncbi:UNVERIFIED_CONTAM: Sodium/calcium exchanger NCL2 [Sesamum radiatum]|uniref:Sodium/calcium exchanger NCL2 n=1 Tax=Sesamum radiatum TaxID=300843 RepID=A0AAW2KGP6_SESRA